MKLYGFVSSPKVLHPIFVELTGDQRMGSNFTTKQINERFEHALLMEDPALNVDLRHHDSQVGERFKIFF